MDGQTCVRFKLKQKYSECNVTSRWHGFVGGRSKKKHKHTTSLVREEEFEYKNLRKKLFEAFFVF